MKTNMITKLILRNFKSVQEQTYSFTNFDLLVGRNNSGKSTVLQAIAIWQFCVDEFHRSSRKGERAMQIVLPNFTALPLPEFNLLWNDRTERKYPVVEVIGGKKKKKQEFIYIEITVKWKNKNNKEDEFGVSLRYNSPQSVYAKPIGGWQEFRKRDENGELPRVVYVPPFSGLEPNEIWYDDGVLRKQVGKAQPGSVLRNLLFRVVEKYEKNDIGDSVRKKPDQIDDWLTIQKLTKKWFGVKLNPPDYEKRVSTEIKITYSDEKGTEFDIIAAGSGFHQVLTLLAFQYGFDGITTILLDEPDAHLHVNLQREILNYFKAQKIVQFVVATHAEEFIKGVSTSNILSVLKTEPERIASAPEIITALADVDNMAVVETTQSPHILYVEGEDDERILYEWASVLNSNILEKYFVYKMGGSSKREMKNHAEQHFRGLKKIVPNVKRVMLFDYDSDETAFHPEHDNPSLYEWQRKNIENYLLVPSAWKRAVQEKFGETEENLFTRPIIQSIDTFFESENLTLPKRNSWQNIKANIFQVVDGKKILFENSDSLFQQLSMNYDIRLNKETIASSMSRDELHEDILLFFKKL